MMTDSAGAITVTIVVVTARAVISALLHLHLLLSCRAACSQRRSNSVAVIAAGPISSRGRRLRRVELMMRRSRVGGIGT